MAQHETLLRSASLIVLLAALSVPAAALAQAAAPMPASTDQAEADLDEVVVTAQKRAENVQDVPISISAFNSRILAAAGVSDVRDLRRITPSLYLATAPQVTNTRVAIRGIGSSANTAIEPSVASFIDGVYVPRVGSLLGSLNDIDSVEVLRGPQGTLFGRNASMGALSFHTTTPKDSYEGQASVTVGNYDRLKASLILNAPLTDTLAVRGSILGDRFSGYGVNEITGRRFGYMETFSGRVAARWEITPDLTWILRADHQHLAGDGIAAISVVTDSLTPTAIANWRTRLDPDGAGPLTGDLPKLTDTYSRRVRQDTGGNLNDTQWGASSDLTWNLGNDYTVKLISGYRDWHNDQTEASSTDVPLALNNRFGSFDSESMSHELQLISPTTLMDSRLNYVAGLYYFDEDYRIGENFSLPPGYCSVFVRNTAPAQLANCLAGAQQNATVLRFAQQTTSYAAYAQATFKLTDAWDVTGGLRYSKDEKDGSVVQQTFNAALNGTRAPENTQLTLDSDKTTYRLNTTYHFNDDVMVFATWATGFKSGGFDSGGGSPASGQRRIFNPELTENFEIGLKSQILDRRLTANATVFRTDIDEYQFRTYDGVSFRVQNNGRIRQQGVEFDLVGRPISKLTLTLAGTYLDSKYLEFRGAPGLPGFGGVQDLTGQRVPYSPKWQGAASAQYGGDLPWADFRWTVRGDMSFSSSANLSAAGDNSPQTLQPGYTLFGGRFTVSAPEDRWEVALYGLNLTNEAYCNSRFGQPNDAAFGLRNTTTGFTVIRCVVSEPRTYGVELKARF